MPRGTTRSPVPHRAGLGRADGPGLHRRGWKYFYLPEPTTDYILSVIGEELGLIAMWLVLALFVYLVLARPADRGGGGGPILRARSRRA